MRIKRKMQEVYGSTTEYSIKELSALIEVPQTTIRDWEKSFSIPVRRNDLMQRSYSENIVRVFKVIKKLKAKGLRQDEIKSRISIDLQTCDKPTATVEIVDEIFNQNEFNISTILKPYTDRITTLELTINNQQNRIEDFISINSMLSERVKNKDEIIEILIEQKTQLEKQLNRSWFSKLFNFN